MKTLDKPRCRCGPHVFREREMTVEGEREWQWQCVWPEEGVWSTGYAGILCRVSHIHVCHKFYSMLHVTLACRLSSTALSLSGQRSPKSSQRSLHHKDADINDSTVRPGWQRVGSILKYYANLLSMSKYF